VSSDGGLLVLKKVNLRHKLTSRFASVILDRRACSDHTIEKMLTQRVYGS